MKLSLPVSLSVLLLASTALRAQSSNRAAEAGFCPRYPAGSTLVEPQDLYSSHGFLRVRFSYQTRLDSHGSTLYCFTTETGAQSPTLHVRPGDELVITLKNDLPASAGSMRGMDMGSMASTAGKPVVVSPAPASDCGAMVMTATSTNLHFHGTNSPPTCHQDEVIKTLINAGETFDYDVHFPLDEAPGLYWYHPHIHGSSEAAVQGGATGAIVVEGLQNFAPEIAGVPQRILIFRDNLLPSGPDVDSQSANDDPDSQPDAPTWDLSLNYIPITYPRYKPVIIPMRPNAKQFWRVLNSAADTILDLELRYDGIIQPLRIFALDGVPTYSQDGTSPGRPITRDHILLAPGARAEFLVSAPPREVKSARLVTRNIDTGPYGDSDPRRRLADISVSSSAAAPSEVVPPVDALPARVGPALGLGKEVPHVKRTLYFSEVLSNPADPDSPTNFYITVDGQTPTLFSPDNPPAIVTTQGAVEDWVIENRALENHEFHIHQIHFLVLEKNHLPVSGEYLDMINLPYWSGTGPYPSVTLRMDFRGPTVGDFVYHCHILGHEDGGMMAIIRVLPHR